MTGVALLESEIRAPHLVAVVVVGTFLLRVYSSCLLLLEKKKDTHLGVTSCFHKTFSYAFFTCIRAESRTGRLSFLPRK